MTLLNKFTAIQMWNCPVQHANFKGFGMEKCPKNIKKAIEGTCQPFDIGKKCYHRIYPFKKNLKN